MREGEQVFIRTQSNERGSQPNRWREFVQDQHHKPEIVAGRFEDHDPVGGSDAGELHDLEIGGINSAVVDVLHGRRDKLSVFREGMLDGLPKGWI